MAIVKTDDKHYKDIADAIRDVAGSAGVKFYPKDLAGEIRVASEIVRDNAYEDGYEEGCKTGRKEEYDRFWDNFQKNGTRTNYVCSFGSGWNTDNFKPKYSMRPTHAMQMFFNNLNEFIYIEDFVEFCKERNIELDFSGCTSSVQYCLASLHTKHLGALDFSNVEGNMMDIFYSHNVGAYSIEKIDEFISSVKTAFRQDTFKNATNLTSIKISGEIGFGVGFENCTKLDKESLMSIINALYNYSGSGATRILTLGATNLAKLTDAEKAIATQKGWTLA